MRQAFFINGCLFNSEVWNSYSAKSIHDLDVIDHMILKTIIGSQSKVPVECLYLETGTMPLTYVISVRRMLYLQTLLKRHNNEVTRKVYNAMRDKPYPGDWYNLVLDDFKQFGLQLDEVQIQEMSTNTFKSLVKGKVWLAAYTELRNMQQNHIKVKHISYTGIRAPQQYMTSTLLNNNMCSFII